MNYGNLDSFSGEGVLQEHSGRSQKLHYLLIEWTIQKSSSILTFMDLKHYIKVSKCKMFLLWQECSPSSVLYEPESFSTTTTAAFIIYITLILTVITVRQNFPLQLPKKINFLKFQSFAIHFWGPRNQDLFELFIGTFPKRIELIRYV